MKTVVVTGGTKGIGAALAAAFSGAGYRTIVAARHDNGIARRLGGDALFFRMDVTRREDHARLVEHALSETGRLDVYINNAGLSGWRSIDLVDEEFVDEMIAVNLKSVLWGCSAAAPRLPAGGSIINISSMAGKRGTPSNSVYCACKFGVNGITQALAKELGPRGIRVNAVCPVLVCTEGLLEALTKQHAPAFGKDPEAFFSDFIKSQAPLGRLPTAEEVASYCLYLASDAASAVSGQCTNVDCGVLPQ